MNHKRKKSKRTFEPVRGAVQHADSFSTQMHPVHQVHRRAQSKHHLSKRVLNHPLLKTVWYVDTAMGCEQKPDGRTHCLAFATIFLGRLLTIQLLSLGDHFVKYSRLVELQIASIGQEFSRTGIIVAFLSQASIGAGK